MANLDAIMARLEQLEADNEALRAAVERLSATGTPAPDAPASPPIAGPMSRRSILRQTGLGVAAAGVALASASAASLVASGTALAAGSDGQAMKVGGNYPDARTTTNLWNQTNDSTVFRAVSTSGIGLLASSRTSLGASIYSDTGNGLRASSTTGSGIRAESQSGKGVWATSVADVAVFATSRDAIGGYAQSTNDDGLMGVALKGGRGVRGESATGAAVYGFSGPYRATRQAVGAVGVYGRSESGRGVVGQSGSDDGVRGVSQTGSAVHGISNATSGQSAGVHGEADGRWGVFGRSRTDVGVRGVSESGIGAYAQSASSHGVMGVSLASAAGLRGESADGTAVFGFSGPYQGERSIPGGVGVYGQAAAGRGGVFAGSQAQVQLKASTAASHPDTGAKGDLFVDDGGRLWFCKGGGTWVQLA